MTLFQVRPDILDVRGLRVDLLLQGEQLGPQVLELFSFCSLVVLDLLTSESCVTVGIVEIFIIIALLLDDFFYNIVQTSIIFTDFIVLEELEVFLNSFLLVRGDRA